MDHRRSLPPMPERIGRYEILLPIASGGMATVYLARTRGTAGFERDVALKVAHAQYGENPEFAEDLVEEAKLAVRIRHPNVVSMLDVGEDPYGLFIVMDYVEGDSLAGLTRRARAAGEPMPIALGIRILADALAGLHAAHELRDDTGQLLGVVHRDFSPQNILVGLDGTSRLADFGIAKAASRRGHTRAGDIKGKIAYLAPEQARSQPVDRRADIWSAGIVAWEIVARQPIHRSTDDDLSLLLKIVSEEPPRLSTIRPDVPEAIEDAVHLALARDPAHRCASAAELAQTLHAACAISGLRVPDTTEVAALVRRLAGPKLGERRARVKDILALRAQMGQISDPLREPPSRPFEIVTPPPEPERIPALSVAPAEARTDVTATGSRTRPPGPRRAGVRGAAMAAIATLVVVGGAIAFLRQPAGDRGARADAAAGAPPQAPSDTQPSLSTGPVASPPLAAPAPSESAAARAPVGVEISANAAMAALQIGDRIVPVPHPARTITIPLTEREAQGPARIEAVSLDGRHANTTIEAGAARASLKFAPGVAQGPRPPPLAPSPYDKHP